MAVEPPTVPIGTQEQEEERPKAKRCRYRYLDGTRCRRIVPADLDSMEGHKAEHDREAALREQLRLQDDAIRGLQHQLAQLRKDLRAGGTPDAADVEDWETGEEPEHEAPAGAPDPEPGEELHDPDTVADALAAFTPEVIAGRSDEGPNGTRILDRDVYELPSHPASPYSA